MAQRINMNSRGLQENFPEVYGKFFSKCEVVVSAPGSFYWFGDHADRYGELAVKQKIPLRAYVGLQADGEDWSLAESTYFVPSDGAFKHLSRQIPRTKRMLEIVREFVRHHGYKGGCRIYILTEVPINCGLSSWGAVSAALSTAIHLRLGIVAVAEIETWSTVALDQLTKPGSPFDRIFRLAWKFDLTYKADAAGGSGAFTAMSSSAFPIIYATEKRSGTRDHHPSNRMPSDLGDDYSFIDRMRYWGFRLHEFFGLRSTENWPLDFGLFYSGSTASAEFSIRSANDIQLAVGDAIETFTAIAKTKIDPRRPPLPPFLERSLTVNSESQWETFLSSLGNITIEGLMAFKQIFDRGYTEQAIDDLFRAIYLYRSHLSIFNVSTASFRFIRHQLMKTAAKEETKLAAKITGVGRGGDFLFVTPLHALEYAIDSLLRTLREKVDSRIWLDYASWIDGYEEQGLKVEQDFGQRRYSQFVSKGAVVVKSWSGHHVGSSVVNLDAFESERGKHDLYIDPIEKKLYVRGQRLTSNELQSTKATIAVLQVLLRNLDQQVGSQHLPLSTYVDRTAMQGKIIGPLCDIFERNTGRKLPLVINGGLRKNFFLMLKSDGLSIGMTESKL